MFLWFIWCYFIFSAHTNPEEKQRTKKNLWIYLFLIQFIRFFLPIQDNEKKCLFTLEILIYFTLIKYLRGGSKTNIKLAKKFFFFFSWLCQLYLWYGMISGIFLHTAENPLQGFQYQLYIFILAGINPIIWI